MKKEFFVASPSLQRLANDACAVRPPRLLVARPVLDEIPAGLYRMRTESSCDQISFKVGL
jgi:hypothetical protein